MVNFPLINRGTAHRRSSIVAENKKNLSYNPVKVSRYFCMIFSYRTSLVWPHHGNIVQAWIIHKNLHPIQGVDVCIFSYKETYVGALRECGIRQEAVESYISYIVEFSNKGSDCGTVTESAVAGERIYSTDTLFRRGLGLCCVS